MRSIDRARSEHAHLLREIYFHQQLNNALRACGMRDLNVAEDLSVQSCWHLQCSDLTRTWRISLTYVAEVTESCPWLSGAGAAG
jgi:hypothetical protein